MPLPRRCVSDNAELRCNKVGAYLKRPTPPLVEEETPFPNINGLGTNKNLVMGPVGA
jgi:hypothetical protein